MQKIARCQTFPRAWSHDMKWVNQPAAEFFYKSKMEFDLESLDIGLEVDGEELFNVEEQEAVDTAAGLNEASGGQDDKQIEQTTNKSRQRKTGKQFNEKLLCGENGIKALPELFEGASLKGKNEEESLNLLLKKYEFWAHQLYPR